jgi:ribonuclease Z
MATHVSYDRELIGEMLAGVRMHYKGLFAFGIDHTVINVTKERIWLREAALPTTSNITRPNLRWLIKNVYDGKVMTKIPKFKWTIKGNQEQAVRDLEIDPALYIG